MRRLCIGDLHGSYDKLMKVLENCKFSDSDILYSLGDFCDRGIQNKKVLDFCMSLGDRFRPIIGNHDWWLYLWLRHHLVDNDEWKPGNRDEYDSIDCWIGWNGGRNTYTELKDESRDWLEKLYNWLKPIPFARRIDNKVLIHSVAPDSEYAWRKRDNWKDYTTITLENLQKSGIMYDIVYDSNLWNRDVIQSCKDYVQIGNKWPSYHQWAEDRFGKEFNGDTIYIIGHTPLDHPFYDRDRGIIGIDTGGFCDKKNGWDLEGSLTILDIDSLDWWTSKDENKHSFKTKE